MDSVKPSNYIKYTIFERYNNIYCFNENSYHTAINLSNIKLVLHIYRALIVIKRYNTSGSFRHTGWGIMSHLAQITPYRINYCNMHVFM